MHLTANGMTRALRQTSLPLWFLLIDLGVKTPQFINGSIPAGADAMIYLRAASMFLAGDDPWAAGVVMDRTTYHFAGLPTDVLVYSPFALLPVGIASVLAMVLAATAAVWVIRHLRLPIWYLLFPPVVEGIYDGNPQLPLLALLIVGLGPIASLLKVYAVLPMLGERRWGALAITVALFGACFLVAPSLWFSYAERFGAISARLVSESAGGYSAAGQAQPLFIATVIALGILAVRDLRTAGWLVVPAVWPASEFHYGVLVLPAVKPAAAAALALPLRGVPAFVTIGYAAVAVARWLQRRRVATQLRPFEPGVPPSSPEDGL